MAGIPEWITPVEAAGVKVKIIHTDDYFPHMAQAIAVSDQTIAEKPEMVRKFVHAALRGMKDIMDDPDGAAKDFVKFVPEWQGKEAEVQKRLRILRQACLCRTEKARRSRCRPPRKAAGFLPGERHHSEEDADRRAIYECVY